MTSRATIYDHFCRRLADFEITTTPRSWVLNGYGKCEFSIGFDETTPQASQLLQERYFQYGNILHIEHIPSVGADGTPNGRLPDWSGIILPPRTWDTGVCHLTAFGAEAILQLRAMPYADVSDTPANVFRRIITEANQAGNIIFQFGVIEDVAVVHQDYFCLNAYDHIQKLIKATGMEWSITGEINSRGGLDLCANLYRRKGIDTSLSLTNINTELADPLLTEQGAISNIVYGYSDAFTKNDRIVVPVVNQNSVNDYGPLQLNQVYQGMRSAASVQSAAQSRLDSRSRPTRTVKRVALDRADTFSYLETGNTVLVHETRAGFALDGGYGFDSRVRILSIDYNDLSDKAPLNVEMT